MIATYIYLIGFLVALVVIYLPVRREMHENEKYDSVPEQMMGEFVSLLATILFASMWPLVLIAYLLVKKKGKKNG